MIKKIEILGIQLDNYTVQEAMLQVEVYLNNTVMNTIEDISMEMLVLAGEDETLKECIEQLDLAIVSDKEILRAAGVNSVQRIRETAEHHFFEEFMKRIIRNSKTVYLFGETEQQTAQLETLLRQDYERLRIVGSFSLEACAGDFDGVVNEINIASPDVIFSVLSTPRQEYFLMENKSRMNAKIWYGLGSRYEKAHGVSCLKRFFRRLLHRGMLKSMLSRYDQEK